MRRELVVAAVVAALIAGCGSGAPASAPSVSTTSPVDSTTSVAEGQPTVAEWPEPYFIMVDLANLSAWGTAALTREEWDAYIPPAGFTKDSVDNYTMTNSVWLRSPDASIDGPTEHLDLNGVDFEHIVDILAVPSAFDADGLLSEVRLVKYHQLTWPSLDGTNWIRLLVGPDGAEYILVNRRPDRVDEYGALADGWSYREVRLEADLTLQLRGEMSNIRDSNGDLYQGPVDIEAGV
jgi:hypothetical protein